MEFDVWIDNEECWPEHGAPVPTATFDAGTAEEAVHLATQSGEFDVAFTRGGTVKLLVRRVGGRALMQFTLEPVIEYRVVQSQAITLQELRNG